MKFFIIFVVAVLSGIGYVRATNNRIDEDAKVPELDEFGNETGAFIVKGAKHMPKLAVILVIATIVAITELVCLFAGEWYIVGMIIAAVAVLGLAIFQFAMATGRQMRAITGVAVAVGVAATMCKAEKFDAFQIYSEGFKSMSSLLITLLAPIIVVGVCGLVQRLRLSGRFNFRTTSDDDSDDETSDDDSGSDSDGEEGRVSGGEIIKTLLPYLALLLVLILIGIGTYVAVTMIKGGM